MFKQQNPPVAATIGGFLFAFGVCADQASYRLCFLSNHLQMQWLATPAITVSKNVVSSVIFVPPSCYQYGAVTSYSISYHTSGFNYKTNRYSLTICRNITIQAQKRSSPSGAPFYCFYSSVAVSFLLSWFIATPIPNNAQKTGATDTMESLKNPAPR